MIKATLQWAAEAMTAKLQGPDKKFLGVSTDSRELNKAELFFCLLGQRDGHDYAGLALKNGASAVVIDEGHRDLAKTLAAQGPCLIVADTLRALGDLAQAWRRKFSIPIVALTGSNGKTTTKEFIRAVLSTQFEVLATAGNFNNLIGVPKTLFQLEPKHEIAVIEMGMNDFGEIARLTEITEPSVALITHIGAAHLEKLGNIAGVTQAKAELFAKMPPSSTALVNLSDARIAQLPTPAQKRYYGTPGSELWAEILAPAPGKPLQLLICSAQEQIPLSLTIPGLHNSINAVAALMVGRFFKIPLAQAIQVLTTVHAAHSRMELFSLASGQTLLDDCYNANPSSMKAALQTLAQLKNTAPALAILGEMLELGEASPAAHTQLGRHVWQAGIEQLIAIGPSSNITVAAAQAAGMATDKIQAFPDTETALAALQKLSKTIRWILIKGSRGAHLEKIVQFLKEQN